MRDTGQELHIEINFDASFDPSRLSSAELEHLSAFLTELLRDLIQQPQEDNKE